MGYAQTSLLLTEKNGTLELKGFLKMTMILFDTDVLIDHLRGESVTKLLNPNMGLVILLIAR